VLISFFESVGVRALEGANFDLRLSAGPNFVSTNGIGIIARATKPRSDDAHRGPRASYICVAKSGKAAPARLRTTVLAASAEAATNRYESII